MPPTSINTFVDHVIIIIIVVVVVGVVTMSALPRINVQPSVHKTCIHINSSKPFHFSMPMVLL